MNLRILIVFLSIVASYMLMDTFLSPSQQQQQEQKQQQEQQEEMEESNNHDDDKMFGLRNYTLLIQELENEKKKNINIQTQTQKSIKEIHFLGERHCGTNWIYNHLRDCFGQQIPVLRHLSRYKHWFQFDNPKRLQSKNSSLVIAQFRNPYEWVEAMRQVPHHAPLHINLQWHDFVTKPWTMPRWGIDLEIPNELKDKPICGQSFTFNETIPCHPDIFRTGKDIFPTPPHYELRHDGSGIPYESIIHLRRDKILNFLNISNYEGISDLWDVQYEEFVDNGTDDILRRIENVTGLKAQCKPIPAQVYKKRKDLDPEFVQWMNQNVDWDVEKKIGYQKWDN